MMEKNATGSAAPSVLEVLLVDDHEPTRQEMVHIIETEPDMMVVAESPNAEQCLNLARTFKTAVIVMDLALPGMNGIEASRAITKMYPELRVLVLSNHVGKDLVNSALSAGARGYLRKDRAYEELIPAIRAVGQGRQFLGDGIED